MPTIGMRLRPSREVKVLEIHYINISYETLLPPRTEKYVKMFRWNIRKENNILETHVQIKTDLRKFNTEL